MKLLKMEPQLVLIGLAATIFLAVGASRVAHLSNDFVPVYTGARCLFRGCNPYDPAQLEQQYFAAAGRAGELPSWDIDVPVYPPCTFLVLSPLALLQYPTARMLWFLLNGCLFVTACGLMTLLCPPRQRWLGAILASIFLLTSGILLVLGQPALLAISLLIIGIYLLLQNRLLLVGSALLTLSLAVKPQIGGLLVLYLVVRHVPRRYAAMALAGALALLVLAGWLLSEHPRSAQWPATLRANLAATLSPGGSADPRPQNQQAIGDVNLQALTSIFSADARIFNVAAYAIFLTLLALWIVVTHREPAMHLPALSALAVLSLLPVYHRFYDTRVLLLTVPAVLMIAQKRRALGTVMAALTLLSIVSVQYRAQGYLLQHGLFQTVLHNKVLFTLLLRQQNLEMVLLFGLYLVAMASLSFESRLAWEQQEPVLALHE